MTKRDELRTKGTLHPVPAADDPGLDGSVWLDQWNRVPYEWRSGQYAIDQAPFDAVFVQNARYKPGRVFDFRPTAEARLGEEVAWWLWTCWREGLRKVEPSMLRWWAAAVGHMSATRAELTGQPVASVTELDPRLVVREAVRLFQAKNGRIPSTGNRRNLATIADHIHLLVSARCTEADWWDHPTWDLAADPRIPRREHEPYRDRPLRLGGIEPAWLREGLRFWLSHTLTYDIYTWTSCLSRATMLGSYFGRYLASNAITHPALVDDAAQLRPAMMRLLSWLRSPEATRSGKPLAKSGVNQAQSMIQAFYAFMVDHPDEAVAFTGDPRWQALGVHHTRLWPPSYASRRSGRRTPTEGSWMGEEDMHRMVSCIAVLGAATTEEITVDLPGGQQITVPGLGDEQAMRAWLIQAMTGRRASEVLMLDYQPLTMLDGIDPDTADDDAFVARLRYQQTKVEGVDPTILVENAVVKLVREQQTWAVRHLNGVQPEYLFLQPRNNHRGLRPRSYRSYQDALKRLDNSVNLTDRHGQPLPFTRTHRLRHTRATELLNAGVAVHVVQRYFGHRSPEMTMWYAQTLAETSEAEFLRYKKVGADGRDLGIDPVDMYEIAQLDKRTDRILPNGYCMLPPAKTCERGNACLSCGHFATDRTRLDDLREQKQLTEHLIAQRQHQFEQRHGTKMTLDNVWLAQRLREVASLDAIIDRLEADSGSDIIRGAGADGRRQIPITPVTDGAHHTATDAANRTTGASEHTE